MKRMVLLVAMAMSLTVAACTPATPSAGVTTRPPTQTVAPSTARESPPSTSTQAAPSPPPSSASPRATAAPTRYTTRTIYRGPAHPDDLALVPSGALLFSDYTNGTISRLGANGPTVLHRGLAGPEGLVLLPDGTLVFAEEKTNRILDFAPGSDAPHLLRTLPGIPTLVECHQGVDGIAWDATTKTLVIPDAVTGTIYRMSPDGRQLTTMAEGFAHPVGAGVDSHGTVYVADECGGNVWQIHPNGTRTDVAPAVMPDDVSPDGFGNLVVTDVRHTRHDVTRTMIATGASTTLARTGLIEPQGLVVDPSGRIFVSDDLADVIIELIPHGESPAPGAG